MGILFMILAASATSWGGCRVDAGLDEAVLVRHVQGTCSPEEKMALAVSADEVLTALQEGKGVDLNGLVLSGDLLLDQLPLQPFDPALVRHAAIVQRFEDESVSEVRVIQGPFRVEDVDVQGVVATNLTASGYVVVRGPVSFRGTTIRRSIDLSRVVFLDRADFSGMHVGHEGFFLRAAFARDADFTRTVFGTRSRFHRALFLGPAAFTDARFPGLAEFLQVSFDGEAGFSHTRFVQGAGFSGSRFRGASDFSEARFEREVYFRFTEFQGSAHFQRAVFRNTADFTEAQFQADADFQSVVFEKPPEFSGVDFPEGVGKPEEVRNAEYHTLIISLALLFLFVVAWSFRKNKAGEA